MNFFNMFIQHPEGQDQSNFTPEDYSLAFSDPSISSEHYNNNQQPDLDQPEITYSQSPETMAIMRSLPLSPTCLQPFPGVLNFQMEICRQAKETKSTSWTFSAITNKLYVQKDILCPIKFFVNMGGLTEGLYIRAMVVYSDPENLQEIVRRCPNHVHAPETANISHREHFIWCEHQSAQYSQDITTGRYSVRMPYDASSCTTGFLTYLFTFKCLSSCAGGPNRRDLSVVFTLESLNGNVLGKQSVDLKICACPGRDRVSDEKKLELSTKTRQNDVKTLQPLQAPATNVKHPNVPSRNKRKISGDETYTLYIRGSKNYELLKAIRDSLEVADLVSSSDKEEFIRQKRMRDLECTQTMTTTVNNQLPGISTFNFSSARPVKGDVVDSTQYGVDMTDGQAPSSTVASWLKSLKLDAYVDDFHNCGVYSMEQLKSEQNFTIDDLESMKLTKKTVSLIWTALKAYRDKINPKTVKDSAPSVSLTMKELPDSQESSPASQNSTVSLLSNSSTGPKSLFKPEFTKCIFKFSVFKRNDMLSQENSNQEKATPNTHEADSQS